jgi:ribonuclease HI
VEFAVIAHLPSSFTSSSIPGVSPAIKLNLPLAKLNATPSLPVDHPSVAAEAIKQYLLVCHARSLSITSGVWCFSLESISGEPILDAECEEEGDLNRLSLLAAVRGLESIDGRGLVSLISNNRYLIRSLDRSLPRWRENEFVWEQFGRRMPVQNADLWKRIDRTLAIHCVTASLLQSTRVSTGDSRFDSPSETWPNKLEGLAVDSPQIRVDAAHGNATTGPSDGLRRWLAGNCDAAPVVTRRGRYRVADLADA